MRILGDANGVREVVLGLPLSRLLLKMVKAPVGADPVETALPVLKAASPFPDDPLTVSCETVREDESGKVIIAAALPESAADDIGEALDAAKLSVVSIDSLVLGQLRGIWSALGESAGRRMVIVRSVDCISIIVLDGDLPAAIRAIIDESELRREVTLSLLEAEDFGGSKKLEEIIVVAPANESDAPVNGEAVPSPLLELADLSSFAPVRTITVGEDAALVGVAERAKEGESALNALPESWREMLEETRFKRKLHAYLAIAGGIWLLAMAVLFGVPMVYGFMADHQKSLSKQHQRQYAAVKEMKAKVDLIHKYSDHARGALEIMKAVSDRLPEGITLSSWSYKRDEGVRVSGDAESAEDVYVFKDAMDEMSDGEEGEEGEKIFGLVSLSGPKASKTGQRFDLDCQYESGEEED